MTERDASSKPKRGPTSVHWISLFSVHLRLIPSSFTSLLQLSRCGAQHISEARLPIFEGQRCTCTSEEVSGMIVMYDQARRNFLAVKYTSAGNFDH